MSGHARLSPSNHRWPHCPGSVREEAAYPDISGDAAVDGTGTHLLLELALKAGCRAEVYIGQQIGVNHPDKNTGWNVCSERAERAQVCLDYIHTRVNDLKQAFPGCTVEVHSESKSDPGGAFGRTDWYGTCDVTITVLDQFRAAVFIEAIDYKDGRGFVAAADNTQLQSYLFGKMREHICSGPEKVRPFMPDRVTDGGQMTIVQPKTFPPIRKQRISAHQLVESAVELSNAARRTDDPNAPLIPDNKGGKGWCLWCKHKQNCTALSERELTTMQQLTPVGAGLDLFQLAKEVTGNLTDMTVDKLTQLADAEPGIMNIFVMAKQEIQRRLEAGEVISGWEMKPSRGSKVWNDTEENIVKSLKGRRLTMQDIYPKSLVSVAQALKNSKLSKEQAERLEKELVTFKAGEDKLTRVAHTKAEKPTAEMMFADVPPAKSEPVPVDFLSAAPSPVEEELAEEVSFF